MRAATLALVLLLPLLLVAWPASADSDSTSIGDVDLHSVYGWPVRCADDLIEDGQAACPPTYPVCGQAFTAWTVRLTLDGPTPGDVVGLTVVFDSSLAGTAFATHEQPSVTVAGVTRTTCHPDAVVAGVVVDGEVPYTLEFTAH